MADHERTSPPPIARRSSGSDARALRGRRSGRPATRSASPGHAPARRPADRVGADVLADAGRGDGRDPLRGMGAHGGRRRGARRLRRDRLRAVSLARRGRPHGRHHLAGHAAARRRGPGERHQRRPSSPTDPGATSSGSAPTGRRRWRARRGSATWWRRRSRRCSSARDRSTWRPSWRRRSPWATRCTCATRPPPGCWPASSPPRSWRRSRTGPTRGDHAVRHPRQRPVLPGLVDVRGQGGGAVDRGLPGSTVVSRWRATGWSSASASPAWATGGSPGRPASSRASTSPGSPPATPTWTPATRRSWRPMASAGWRWPPRRPCRGSSARSSADAVATTRHMAEICVGRNPLFPMAPLGGEGTPTGIDVRKVVERASSRAINTAIAHRERAPHDRRRHRDAAPRPFVAALVAFGEAHPLTPATRSLDARSRGDVRRSFYQDSMVLMRVAAACGTCRASRGRGAHGDTGQPRDARRGRTPATETSRRDPGDLMVAVTRDRGRGGGGAAPRPTRSRGTQPRGDGRASPARSSPRSASCPTRTWP